MTIRPCRPALWHGIRGELSTDAHECCLPSYFVPTGQSDAQGIVISLHSSLRSACKEDLDSKGMIKILLLVIYIKALITIFLCDIYMACCCALQSLAVSVGSLRLEKTSKSNC